MPANLTNYVKPSHHHPHHHHHHHHHHHDHHAHEGASAKPGIRGYQHESSLGRAAYQEGKPHCNEMMRRGMMMIKMRMMIKTIVNMILYEFD